MERMCSKWQSCSVLNLYQNIACQRSLTQSGTSKNPEISTEMFCYNSNLLDFHFTSPQLVLRKCRMAAVLKRLPVFYYDKGLWCMLYSRTSMARTSLGQWKFVRDMGSSSHWGLNMVPVQEANSDNLGKSFRFSTQWMFVEVFIRIASISHNIQFHDKIRKKYVHICRLYR